MACVPVVIKKDFLGGSLYASRNHNELRHTYEQPGVNRTNVDWNLTLRQAPRISKPTGLKTSVSAPNLHEGRHRDPLTAEHADGPYFPGTVGHYHNMANTGHMMLHQLVRVSSGSAHSLDWQLQLRNGLHRHERATEGEFATKWRPHYARGQVSFDRSQENCSKDNELYWHSFTTPQDRRPDRSNSALPITMIRDDPIDFKKLMDPFRGAVVRG